MARSGRAWFSCSRSTLFVPTVSPVVLAVSLCLMGIYWFFSTVHAPNPIIGHNITPSPRPSLTNRPLVTYVYYETDNARANLEFFLRHGLHSDADFVFILNGATDDARLIPTDRPNVRIVQRDNSCFDLGSHGDVLRQDGLWKQYKRFITMNASIRGPFLPHWVAEGTRWTDLFLNKVTDEIKVCVRESERERS
jgi:hypothetical protein